MPLFIERNDLTKIKVDAIVNAANETLLGGGGVDGAIHKAAGPELLKECKNLNGCSTGEAKITNAYNLPCKKIIHTVGPIWHGGGFNEEVLLKNCYQNSLNLALEGGIKTIAFPLISSGAYRFPKEKALKIAKDTIKAFLAKHDMTVYMVVFDEKAFSISKELFQEVSQYIDENYVEEASQLTERTSIYRGLTSRIRELKAEEAYILEERECETEALQAKELDLSLDELVNNLNDTFSQRLLNLIDMKGKDDVEVYKKANIDRKLFSKIKSNIDYKPSKTTTIAFALALELSLDECKDLLNTAGFALSKSSKFDVIIEYFLRNKNYDIFEVNETLFEFGEKTLGE